MTASPPRRVEPGAVFDVLDAASSAVVGVDGTGVIDYVNDQALSLFGYRPEELLGQPVELLLPPDRATTHPAQRAAYADQPMARVMGRGEQLQGRCRDGSLLPLDVQITPLETEHGPWFLAAVTDVTARLEREHRMQGLSRAYLTLNRINQAIVRATTPHELFEATCRAAVEAGDYLGAWIARRGPGWTVLSEARAGSLDGYIDDLVITTNPDEPQGHGPVALALRDNRVYYSGDFLGDAATAPSHRGAAGSGIRSSVTMPLSRRGRTVAALTLWSAEAGIFDEQMRSLLEGVARNVSFALDAFEAHDQLQRVAAQRSDLLRRLVLAQEEERARIAADVHDDSVQSLAAVDLRLGLLLGSARSSAPQLEPAIVQLQEIVTSVTKGLRGLLFALEPLPDGATLTDLLRDVAAHTFEDLPIAWSVTERGPVPSLPSEVVTPGVRIVQEALVNVLKHARATEVRIEAVPEDDGIAVRIADNGVGLRPDHLDSRPGHRGVATMRDRASAAGGHCHLESSDTGTTVHLWLPRRTPSTVVT